MSVATDTQVVPPSEVDADLVAPCDGCGRNRPVVVGIILLETGDQEAEDLGFCSVPCMVVKVRSRWIEGRR